MAKKIEVVGIQSLSTSLKEEVEAMLVAKKLPKRLKWRDDVEIVDHEAECGGSYNARFVSGFFTVKIGDKSWQFDCNLDTKGADIVWKVEIEIETGQVYAVPKMVSKQTKGPKLKSLKVFGVNRRLIGNVGHLMEFCPDPVIRKEYRISRVFGKFDAVVKISDNRSFGL